ncbi:hypothetical protein [Acinetobacter bereziniae]|uniref:hypothetical protein n=1 Tax=Acinetobacter bereziniae TaxID=106648 RepID=UPI0012506778|nr:hypothetical protein [Acinetobacter bereziniae]
MKTTIETNKGSIYAELLKDNDFLQLNVFHVPKGNAGFFLMFPLDKYEEMMHSARTLIENGEELPSDTDITYMVKGCLLAGTAPKFKFNAMAFGTPMIKQSFGDHHDK